MAKAMGLLLLFLATTACLRHSAHATDSQESRALSSKKQLDCAQLGAWVAGEEQAELLWDGDKAHTMCSVSLKQPVTPPGLIASVVTYHVQKDYLVHLIHHLKTGASASMARPVLTGVTEQLALRFSSLLCFPRLGYLWQRFGSGSFTTTSSFKGSSTTEDIGLRTLHFWLWGRGPAVQARPASHQRLLLDLLVQAAAGVDSAHYSPALAATDLAAARAGTGTGTAEGGPTPQLHGHEACKAAQEACRPPQAWLDITAALYWLGWLLIPGLLVAHDSVQRKAEGSGQDHSAVQQDMRAHGMHSQTHSPGHPSRASGQVMAGGHMPEPVPGCQALGGRVPSFTCSHVATVALALVVSGLVNAWVPLVGTAAAAYLLVWAYALVAPGAVVYAILVCWMPVRRRRSHSSSRSHRGDQHHAAAAAIAAAANAAAAAAGGAQPTVAGSTAGVGLHSATARSGAGARPPADPPASASALTAAVHWPPPLDLPGWLEETCNIPDAFRCPITLSVMREPTQASSGVTYERSAIFLWLEQHRVDPVTHASLKRHRLTPNLNLRQLIDNWARAQEAEAAKGC